MKRTIRLTESDLHRIVKECVRNIISEGNIPDNYPYRDARNIANTIVSKIRSENTYDVSISENGYVSRYQMRGDKLTEYIGKCLQDGTFMGGYMPEYGKVTITLNGGNISNEAKIRKHIK